jgi:hypothetical protein
MAIKVVSVKRHTGTFRGLNAEEWSNSYLLSGPAPADPAAWDALFLAVWAKEAPCLHPQQQLSHFYGYDDPAGNATRGRDYLPDNKLGTMVTTSAHTVLPLDMCALAKFRVGQNVKGRPRYVMKWLRGQVTSGGNGGVNPMAATQQAALAGLRDGTLPDGRVLQAPDGTPAGAPVVSPYLMSRDVKRRGKRPI